jgi:hypothetical protein
VQSDNLLSGLLSTVVGAGVTATRPATSTCSVPATVTFQTVAGGLLSGNIAYGNWTFTSGTASTTKTINAGTTSVTLTINDSSCPTFTAPVTLTANQSATIYGTTTYANLTSGTITAARAAQGACAATTQSISFSSGVGSANQGFGTWTFSVNGQSAATSWPSLSVSTTGALSTTVTVAASCSSTLTPVTITVKDSLLTSLTGTLRATMQGDGTVCQPTGASTTTSLAITGLLGLLSGNVSMNLLPGTYVFSVDGHTTASSTPATLTVPGSTALTLKVN